MNDPRFKPGDMVWIKPTSETQEREPAVIEARDDHVLPGMIFYRLIGHKGSFQEEQLEPRAR